MQVLYLCGYRGGDSYSGGTNAADGPDGKHLDWRDTKVVMPGDIIINYFANSNISNISAFP
jgi:hypothetical protein